MIPLPHLHSLPRGGRSVPPRGFFAAAEARPSSCMRRARRELGSSAAFAVAINIPLCVLRPAKGLLCLDVADARAVPYLWYGSPASMRSAR